jgi:magnesium transporter
MAMGGNVGLQASTTVVRGLATGTITVGKALRVVLGEFHLGVTLGLMAAVLTGGMAYIMNHDAKDAFKLSIVVFFSMMLSLCVASTMGALTPLLLQRIKIDPAVSSGPLITSINDMVNVTIYLSVATFLLV